MKGFSTRSHLACIANNLGWVKDVRGRSPLLADCCPGRDVIMQDCGCDAAVDVVLCACERACVEMRAAYNRRDMGSLIRAWQERTACRDKLAAVLVHARRVTPALSAS